MSGKNFPDIGRGHLLLRGIVSSGRTGIVASGLLRGTVASGSALRDAGGGENGAGSAGY